MKVLFYKKNLYCGKIQGEVPRSKRSLNAAHKTILGQTQKGWKQNSAFFPWSSFSEALTSDSSRGFSCLYTAPCVSIHLHGPASHLKTRFFLLHSWAEKEVLFSS